MSSFAHNTLPRGLYLSLLTLGSISWKTLAAESRSYGAELAPIQETTSTARAQDSSYHLESLQIEGTSRVSRQHVRELLRLQDDTLMTDQWMSEARANLLGIGIFRDVTFVLRKGTKPGWAILTIKFEDDTDVLSDWAAGGEFGLSLTKPSPSFGEDSVFRGYRIGLISRNLFTQSHRAAMLSEINARGDLVFGHLAYGLPRFVAEAIQFDAAITAVEPKQRYFETEGFGIKAQSIWTRQRMGFDLSYGVAWYSNTHSRYQFSVWPEVVAGPKLGIALETRFLSFLPSEGYRAALSLIPSLFKRSDSIAEVELAGTFIPWKSISLTTAGRALSVGKTAITTRIESKIEIPMKSSDRKLRSLIYIAVRSGQDHYKDQHFTGTETIAGYRYHSTAFIGDLSFRIVGEHPFKNATLGATP